MWKRPRPWMESGGRAVLLAVLCATLAALPAFAAERVSVSVPVANVRSGPGTGHEAIWKVEKYHPIQVIRRSGEWIHFQDYEGDKGWIHQSVVDGTDAVIVRRENCNVRSGPDTDNPVRFVAEQGVPFQVTKREGSWLRIRHADGDEGWIHQSLVW
jgi:SH3-like domain-containing protein